MGQEGVRGPISWATLDPVTVASSTFLSAKLGKKGKMKGRKPKPSALRLLEGNPGKRPINENEPHPEPGIPPAPEHLSARAKSAWDAISVKLDKVGILTEMDDWALEQLCENYAEIVELREEIKHNGRFQTVTNKLGESRTVNSPAWSQLADAEKRFRGMLEQFGLTPSARTRVKATPRKDFFFERYRARRFLA
jgi:P27 family predicted phage terminase small subunit